MEEEYRKYDDEWSFSNYGNVLQYGRPYRPCQNMGYFSVAINGKMVRVHTIIGKLFQDYCGEWKEGYHTHHIDRNRGNNNVTNLKNLSPSEHKKIHQFEDGVVKPVEAYNGNGEKVGEYDSLTEAQNSTGALQTHIGRVCSGKRDTAGKLFWVFKDDPDKESKVNEWKASQTVKHQRDSEKKLPGLIVKLHKAVQKMENDKMWEKHWVYVTDVYTGEITHVKNAAEASRLYGVNTVNLSNHIKKGKPYLFSGKVFWKK